MAYFPKSIMIDVKKADVPNASGSTNPILAEDYYLLADEIIAIENFLGVARATQADRNNLVNLNPTAQNMLDVIYQLVAGLNSLTSNGVVTSSGYVNKQQRILFPEDAWVSFLASPPGASDASINVLSTSGFPKNGRSPYSTISIPCRSVRPWNG